MKQKKGLFTKDKTNFFNKSVRNQILIPFLILIILSTGTIAVVSWQTNVNSTTEILTDNVKTQTNSINNSFELFFGNLEDTINRLSANDLIVQSQTSNKKDILNYLRETKESTEAIINLYTTSDTTGDIFIWPEATFDADFQAKERDWYKNAVAAEGEVTWKEPYEDAATGDLVITASKAYYKNNKLAGVVAADIKIDALVQMMSSVQFGKTGYGFITDKNGTIIAHPEESLIGKNKTDQEYQDKMTNSGSAGSIDFGTSEKKSSIEFVSNPTTGWVLGGIVYADDFVEQANKSMYPIAVTIIIVIVLAFFVALRITKGITTPIKLVMDRMKLIASGDLSHPSLEVKQHNEIGQLITAANDMNLQVRQLLEQINTVSETVSDQSEELTQAAGEVKAGTRQIAITMEELATGSETQANSASSLSAIMGTFSNKMEQTNHNGEQIQLHSDQVIQMTEQGNELMKTSTSQMGKIDSIVKDAVDKMQNLDNQSQEISKLVSVIKDVADQTNLLALNAAIEAARAGEHGKGFAVVADEVRKLAEQVAHSVNDITTIVSNIQTESSIASNSLKEGYAEVEQGTIQIKNTGETFQEIHSAVTNMAEHIQEISENLSDMAASSQEINGAIEDIAAVTEESAAGVEETAASAEQSSSSMEEVASSSDKLTNLSDELHKLVGTFKV